MIYLKRFFSLVFAILIIQQAGAQQITPAPVEINYLNEKIEFPANVTIAIRDNKSLKSAQFLQSHLKEFYGKAATIKTANEAPAKTIYLEVMGASGDIPNSYTINGNAKNFIITGSDEAGLFYGVQTLLQLLPNQKTTAAFSLPGVNIKDYPRFNYRGMHLDVTRHIFPVSYIKKYIDYLAYHKFNNFHWHLTDDQGWRIEIKKYPRLTQVGAYRDQTLKGNYGSDIYDGKRYGGFYTQAQIREVVKYAADRYITVIPEIEMPGHAVAALTSYPHLGCTGGPYKVRQTWGVAEDIFCGGNEQTYQFLEGVLDEVITLFPSRFIHIGGDEAPKDRWKECPKCQAKIKKEGLKDEHELQSYFVQRMEKYLNKKGRKIIGWDEILEGGLAPNATVMSWRGEAGGIEAANQNHDVLMTPTDYVYFDYAQSYNEDSVVIGGYLPLEKVYKYEPIPASLPAEKHHYVLGAQANMWTEYINNPSKLEYMLFPRMTALSEVLWSPKNKRNWDDFQQRIPGIFSRYSLWGANHSNAYYDVETSVEPGNNKGEIGWHFNSKSGNYRILVHKKDPATGSLNRKAILEGSNPSFIIRESGDYVADVEIMAPNSNVVLLNQPAKYKQSFNLNKASQANIVSMSDASKPYEAKGAFTLLDGVQNTQGLRKRRDFVGFQGKDMELVLSFEQPLAANQIILHALDEKGSWVHPPKEVAVYESSNGTDFNLVGKANSFTGKGNVLFTINKPLTTKFIKIIARNMGIIPSGNAGEGNGAWMMLDELEIK